MRSPSCELLPGRNTVEVPPRLAVMDSSLKTDAMKFLPGILVPQVSATTADTVPVDGDMIPLNAR